MRWRSIAPRACVSGNPRGSSRWWWARSASSGRGAAVAACRSSNVAPVRPRKESPLLPMRFQLASLAAWVLLALAVPARGATCAVPSHPLISEILYDAAGDDTGREFVELLNPSAKTFALAGARLE